MNKKNTLLAVVVATMMMLSACNTNTNTNTNTDVDAPASSDTLPASSSSSEPPTEPPVTAEPPAPPIEVTTQTKTVEGFTGGQVNNGTLYINGGIAKLGDKLINFNNALAKGGLMITTDKEKIRTGGSYGDGFVDDIDIESMIYAMGMQFKWYNPYYEQDVKLMDTKLLRLEARTWASEAVQAYHEVGAEKVKEPEIVLPNGWYLGGTVSVEDRMALLPGIEPQVNPSDEYTWYHYYDEDEKTCTVWLKFDNATGAIIEIQMYIQQIRE